MSLTRIEYGSVASSKVVNDNFNYLDSLIEALNDDLTQETAAISSRINNLSASVDDISVAKIAVGMILPYVGASNSIPTGFLLCNGAEILIDEFPNLFSTIGRTFGSTSGESFCLPDLRDKTLWGVGENTLGQTLDSKLPNIKGQFRLAGTQGYSDLSGAFTPGDYGGSSGKGHSTGAVNPLILFDASNSNDIYSDDASVVQPPAVVVNFIIKY